MTATQVASPKHTSKTKINKAEQAQHAFADMLIEASQRGFHGTMSLSLIIQDGRIQYLRTSSERVVR